MRNSIKMIAKTVFNVSLDSESILWIEKNIRTKNTNVDATIIENEIEMFIDKQ